MQVERAGGSQRHDVVGSSSDARRTTSDAVTKKQDATDVAVRTRATSTASDASPTTSTSSTTPERPRPTLQSALDSRVRFGRETGANDLAWRLQARFDATGAAPLRPEPAPTAGPVGAPRTTTGPTAVARVQQVGDRDYQAALDNQRALSQARQDLGNAQLELDGRNPLQRGWDWVTGAEADKQQNIVDLKQKVTDLEAAEAKLPKDAVAQARLTVFDERLAAVEQAKGKGEAARLARQTYYNSGVWNGAAGTEAASQAELDAAGFPHGAYHDGAAAEGYDGEMQTRDGGVVNMGHVACALDWQVNGRGGFPNPFDANAVTLTGDLASAILHTPTGASAAAAIDGEGDADWNGDLDGNNLAHRLAEDPDASLAATVSSYYEAGDYAGRVDEWATHSKYVVRDDTDTPLRDADGHYVLDRDQLQRDANGFAFILGQGATLDPRNHFEDRAVIDAWADWFNSQPQSPR